MIGKQVHLMGAGGIGMSALARILLAQGVKISGCDLRINAMIRKLEASGMRFYQGHDPGHLKGGDVLIHTAAVSDAPEIVVAREKGISVYRRGQFLARLVNEQFNIAVCGAHGKTTTTSLIATVLKESGLDPTFLIGGEAENLGGNAALGRGGVWVVEADESDGSFLDLEPKIGVVTNIDREHLDFYKNEHQIWDAYEKFMNGVLKEGILIVCSDDPGVRKLMAKMNRPMVTYGRGTAAQIQARNVRLTGLSSEFDLYWKDRFLSHVKVNIPGEHNVLNALAAFAAGMEVGLSPGQIARAILAFHGAGRRFQIKNQVNDIWVIDDYAHHPTEIEATLRSVRQLGRRRLVSVFQPHRYTRTHALLKEFSGALRETGHLILTEIYAASEMPIPGVSGRQFYEKIVEYGHPSCEFIERKDKMIERLLEMAQPGDTLLFLGAGDITEIADEVAEKLRRQAVSERVI